MGTDGTADIIMQDLNLEGVAGGGHNGLRSPLQSLLDRPLVSFGPAEVTAWTAFRMLCVWSTGVWRVVNVRPRLVPVHRYHLARCSVW
jgi:hypothetical protein